MPISPESLEQATSAAVAVLSDILPLPGAVFAILKAVLPPLVGWVATEIEAGSSAADTQSKLLEMLASGSDAIADDAERKKFGA